MQTIYFDSKHHTLNTSSSKISISKLIKTNNQLEIFYKEGDPNGHTIMPKMGGTLQLGGVPDTVLNYTQKGKNNQLFLTLYEGTNIVGIYLGQDLGGTSKITLKGVEISNIDPSLINKTHIIYSRPVELPTLDDVGSGIGSGVGSGLDLEEKTGLFYFLVSFVINPNMVVNERTIINVSTGQHRGINLDFLLEKKTIHQLNEHSIVTKLEDVSQRWGSGIDKESIEINDNAGPLFIEYFPPINLADRYLFIDFRQSLGQYQTLKLKTFEFANILYNIPTLRYSIELVGNFIEFDVLGGIYTRDSYFDAAVNSLNLSASSNIFMTNSSRSVTTYVGFEFVEQMKHRLMADSSGDYGIKLYQEKNNNLLSISKLTTDKYETSTIRLYPTRNLDQDSFTNQVFEISLDNYRMRYIYLTLEPISTPSSYRGLNNIVDKIVLDDYRINRWVPSGQLVTLPPEFNRLPNVIIELYSDTMIRIPSAYDFNLSFELF